MACRAITIGRANMGIIAAAFVVAVILGPLFAVFWRAGGGAWLVASDMAAIRFTIWQALLSALISVGLAIPVARALARRKFRGRAVLITLLGAPFILPVIVAVLGLLAVFGRSGILAVLLSKFGLSPVSIYGLQGVVIAHVFFNLPLATRIILQGWQAIPSERFRLAEMLGFGPREIARTLEYPMLLRALPGAFLIVFAICLSSFAVALTLGGGPRATTIELAIYQAFRFDFDLARAAVLASVQIALVAVVAVLALRMATGDGMGAGLDRVVRRWDVNTVPSKVLDGAVLLLSTVFLLLPLTMIVLNGIAGLGMMPPAIWAALGRSVLVALAATSLTVVLGLAMATTSRKRGWIDSIGLLGVTVSPMVIGTGLFLLINPWVRPTDVALAVTVLVNAVMALPFMLRILTPACRAVETDYGRLADSLGMTGWARLRWLILPRIRRALGFGAGLTAALSMGDLGVVMLFANPENATLPLQMYRLMGAYQMQAAAGAGLVLLMASLLLFWGFDRGGRHDADA